MSERPAAAVPEGTVTVLFTDLVSSTELNQSLGDEQARAVSRAVEQLVQESVERHRGIPIKGLGDGVMVAFTSARRAVTCATEIQRQVARRNRSHPDTPVEMRIGLHTGEVLEEDGDLHGETVIIAKRIEGAARPSTIFASETVHGVLGTARDDLVDAGEHELKGITAPWHLYEVPWRADEPANGSERPFVGRAADVAVVRGALEDAVAGRGSFLLVSGDAGVGKSRLVAEALATAADVGAVVLSGQCLDLQPPPPYQPIVDHVDAVRRALPEDEFRAVLGENAAEVATLVPALRQRFDLPVAPTMPPDQERQYVLHGMAEFIQRGAERQPLVLVYEDLHWVDESTLVLLQTILGRLDALPILLVATMRPTDAGTATPLAAALPTLLRHPATREHHLEPLDRAAVAEVVGTWAGRTPPDELIDLLCSETEGNPYFLEELYRHLADAGRLVDDTGEWQTGLGVGETEVPKGVQLLLGRRLDAVDPEHRRVLATAAAFGREFSVDLLEEVATVDEDLLLDALETGERHGLIADTTRDGRATYHFTHELLRQTLLGDLALARRQRVHRRIADALAELGEPTRAVEVSAHYALAGGAAPDDVAGAAHLAAGRASYAGVAFEDALVHLDHAEDRLATGSVERAEVAALRSRCLRGLARTDEAVDTLRAAIGSVDHDAPIAFELRTQLVQLQLDLFRGDDALAEVARLGDHPLAADPGRDVEVTLLTARARYIQSLDDREFRWPTRQAYEHAYLRAVEIGDDAGAVRALLGTAWFEDYWPDYQQRARDNLAEAARLATELGDEELELDVAVVAANAGSYQDQVDALHALYRRLEERRDPLRLKELCFSLMWLYLRGAEFDRGVQVCNRGIELAEQLGVPPVMYGSIKTLHLVEAGRYAEIDAALDQEVDSPDLPFARAMRTTAEAHHLGAIGAWEEAFEVAERASRLLHDVGRDRMQAIPRHVLVVAAARLGRDDPLAGEFGWDEARIDRFAGAEVRLAAGDLEGAASRAREIVERTTDQRARLHATVVLAESLVRAGDGEAADVAAEALALTERHGMGSRRWQARALLADVTDDATARAEAAAEHAALRDAIRGDRRRAAFDRHPVTDFL